jgi:hypothetical protein
MEQSRDGWRRETAVPFITPESPSPVLARQNANEGVAMNATVLYRIAAVIFVLFAAGHTFGFLKFKPDTPEGISVNDAMRNVQFRIGSRNYTYNDFYTGFGLQVTVYLLFSAILSWQLGTLATTSPHVIGIIGWAFSAVQVIGLVLSVVYFFPVTWVFSGVIALCVGLAAWFT